MHNSPQPPRGQAGARLVWLIAIVGALAVVVGLIVALSDPSPPAPPSARQDAAAQAGGPASASEPRHRSLERADSGQGEKPANRSPGTSDRITGLVLPQSEPTSVRIARIGVSSPLVHLGLDAQGAMEVPTDPAEAGWYTGGPSPGALGPAIIAGHVTWNGTPGVFFKLGDLRRGDRVAVRRADGSVALFSVRRVVTFPKAEFPTRSVFGAIDHAGLRLITCGGLYDESAHRYLDNVVVFADLTGVERS